MPYVFLDGVLQLVSEQNVLKTLIELLQFSTKSVVLVISNFNILGFKKFMSELFG